MSKFMPLLLGFAKRAMLAAGLIWSLGFQLAAEQPAGAEEAALPRTVNPTKPTPREYSPDDPNAPIPRSSIIVSDKNQPRGTPIPSTSPIGQDILNRQPRTNGAPLGSPLPPSPHSMSSAARSIRSSARHPQSNSSRQPKPLREAASNAISPAPASAAPYAPTSVVGPVPGFAAAQPTSILTGNAGHQTAVQPAVAAMPANSVLTTDNPTPAPTPASSEPVPVAPEAAEADQAEPAAIAPTTAAPTTEGSPASAARATLSDSTEEPAASSSAANPPVPTTTPVTETVAPRKSVVPPDAPEPSPTTTALAKPRRETALRIPKIKAEDVVPSTFQEIEPGVSTLVQLFEAWGKPLEQTGDEKEGSYAYEIDPFEAVEVRTTQGVVSSILINLKRVMSPENLTERLQLGFIRTVEVRDEQGQALGRAFPERGVLFSYDPAAIEPQVARILLETIDPQAFSLRAETYWRSQSAASLADLGFVLENQPEAANAWHLQAKIYLKLGQMNQALESAKQACSLAPEEQSYALTHAQCLARRGEYEEARVAAEAVRDAEGVNTLAKAQALLLLGDLLAEGSHRDYKSAIENHLEAIKLAEPLAVDPLVATRLKAKEILLEATLSVARDIAWGNWNHKGEVVPKWVERADAYARDAIKQDGAGVELRIQVIERAMSAHTGFKPAVDPARFLEVAETLTQKLTDSTEDPLARQAAEWELGRIYNHAVRLAHLRGTVDEGLKYGNIAQQKLEQAAIGREASIQARNELGRLYFHMGVLHAVHKQDHEKAVEWYDKAHALLTPPAGQTAEEPGQLGEMLISMGVSYWQIDLKQKGLELTSQGAKYVKQAVDQGTLAPSSLSVPYANLASMHQELGHPDQAKEITRTAEKLEQQRLK